MSHSQLPLKSSHTNGEEEKKQDKGKSDLTKMSPQATRACCPFSSPSAHAFRAPAKVCHSLVVEDGDSDSSFHGCVLPKLKIAKGSVK